MKVIAYAIRHAPSRRYLPSPKGESGRGGSFVEPIDPYVERPRLFHSRRAAETALRQWLRGRHYGRTVTTHPRDQLVPETHEYVDVVPDALRRGDEMEVVEIELTLPS